MAKGETIDTVTVENPGGDGEFAATLRFVDWDIPDHRDTRGYAVPRYSLKIDHPSGDSATFTAWGSIHAAEEQDPTLNVSAVSMLESVLNDGLMWYHECDGTHDMLDRQMTGEAIKTDLADAVDNLAAEWAIESPSEAVRALGNIMETARKLYDTGLDYHPLHDLYQATREEMGE